MKYLETSLKNEIQDRRNHNRRVSTSNEGFSRNIFSLKQIKSNQIVIFLLNFPMKYFLEDEKYYQYQETIFTFLI